MKIPATLLGLLFLAACAAPAVISDINDSALKIQVDAWTPPSEIERRARDGCAIYEKDPVPVSYSCLDNNCMRRELLFACKAPSRGSAATASGTSAVAIKQLVSGLFDGRWVGEGANDGCGSPWAMEISIRDGRAKGMLWRGRAEYNFEGRLDGEGRLEKVLAAKTAVSTGIVGPRFITVNAAFAEETADADYSMATTGPGLCTVAVILSRHQA
jgi:hypothetical protein